jgi:hypothetical protein
MVSGFRREVAENCALLGYYSASSDNFLPTFREHLSVPSSGFKNLTLRMGAMGCSEMLVRNYHYSLLNHSEERSTPAWKTLPFPHYIHLLHILTQMYCFIVFTQYEYYNDNGRKMRFLVFR